MKVKTADLTGAVVYAERARQVSIVRQVFAPARQIAKGRPVDLTDAAVAVVRATLTSCVPTVSVNVYRNVMARPAVQMVAVVIVANVPGRIRALMEHVSVSHCA